MNITKKIELRLVFFSQCLKFKAYTNQNRKKQNPVRSVFINCCFLYTMQCLVFFFDSQRHLRTSLTFVLFFEIRERGSSFYIKIVVDQLQVRPLSGQARVSGFFKSCSIKSVRNTFRHKRTILSHLKITNSEFQASGRSVHRARVVEFWCFFKGFFCTHWAEE